MGPRAMDMVREPGGSQHLLRGSPRGWERASAVEFTAPMVDKDLDELRRLLRHAFEGSRMYARDVERPRSGSGTGTWSAC